MANTNTALRKHAKYRNPYFCVRKEARFVLKAYSYGTCP